MSPRQDNILDSIPGVTISPVQLEKLQAYVELLMRWNKIFNLTAIRDHPQIMPVHIYDSLVVAPYLRGESCLDVGSGAGLPGIPLAIIQQHRQFTLLDTNGKKTRFIRQAAIALGLDNLEVVQVRVEKWSPEKLFDAIISRAFASIRDFVTFSSHCLASDGCLYAMKGRYPDEEIAELPQSFCVYSSHELHVPQLDASRYLIEIMKDE